MVFDEKESARKIYRATEALVKKERELRKKFDIGDRYKAIASRIESIFNHVQQAISLPLQNESMGQVGSALSEDECYIFVHLFNAKGKLLPRWESMLSPRLLHEYSVNRPIYADKKQVEAYIRSRSEREEHAFLMIKIAKKDILETQDPDRKDPLGQHLLKLKEGSLKEQGLVYFFHQDEAYVLQSGHLKKTDAESLKDLL